MKKSANLLGIGLGLSIGVLGGIAPAFADDGLPAEVIVVEPTGSETQVFAKLAGQEVVALLRERILVKPGDNIRLKPDTRYVHLFDEATGKRLNA